LASWCTAKAGGQSTRSWPRGSALEAVERGLGLPDLGKNVAHPLEIHLPGVGERKPAGGAVEQAHAQVLLEVGDQPGDDRGDRLSSRASGEAALVDHPGENAHRAQAIHCKVLIVSNLAIRH
jgi:hypothetical protein